MRQKLIDIQSAKTQALCSLTTVVLLLSGYSHSNDTSSDQSATEARLLATRIATQLSSDNGEAWLCSVDEVVVSAYLFLPAGQIAGVNPEHQLGMEIDHSKASMADQVRYLWSTSGDSLVMNILDRRTSVTWSNIDFVDDNYIVLESSDRGLMSCYRGTGALPKVE